MYSEQCVTRAYLKPWHIQNSRHIHNTAKHLLWNISFKTLCNPDIFRALLYSQVWYILKSKHIQSSAKHLRWSILLKTLCNYSIFRPPVCSKTFAYCVNYSLMYQLFFRTTNLLLLLYSLLFIKSITYSLAIDFFQPVLGIWATELLITLPIVDIWQSFEYGLRVKRKEKYLYSRKCNNNTSNSKKRNSGR